MATSRGSLWQQARDLLDKVRCRRCRGAGVAFRGRPCQLCNGSGFKDGDVYEFTRPLDFEPVEGGEAGRERTVIEGDVVSSDHVPEDVQ